MSAELSITFFVTLTALGFLVTPFIKKKFSESEFVNMMVRRLCWIVGVYMMALNSGVMLSIANANSLGVTHEIFRYMWLFGWLGYFLVGFMFIKLFIDIQKMLKIKKQKKRMGEDG